jgi:2-phospho-L-lactate guanylyltransferase
MSGTAARSFLVIPVKPPSGSKQRLSVSLADQERELVSRSLAIRAVGAAVAAWPLGRLVVVSADPILSEFCHRFQVATVSDPGAGQSAAVSSGAEWCLERGANVLATVAADLPSVTASDLALVLRLSKSMPVGAMVLFPDLAGTGTNGLVVRPANLQVHSFGPDSRRRHQLLAASLGIQFRSVEVPGLAWDVDRPEDLERPAVSIATPHPVVSWAHHRAAVAGIRTDAIGSACPDGV